MQKDHTFAFINTAAIIIILGAVKIMEPIISPLLVALFIAAISAPAMFWLMSHKIPQSIALSIVICVVFIASFLIFNVVGKSLSHFIADIPSYQQKLQLISLNLIPKLETFGIAFNTEEIHKVFDLGAIMGFVGKTFSGVLNTLTNAFLIFLLVIFILIEFASFGVKVRQITKKPEKTMASLQHFSNTLNQYIVLKSLMSLLTAIPIMFALMIMDIDYPFLWGFLIFILNFIPNVGSIIAAIPIVLLALVQQGYISAIIVFAIIIIVNNIVGNVIEPKIMGRRLGLSSLVVFISLVFWGWLLGTVGMFLSVPLTMALKIALESNEKMMWLAILLGNQDEGKREEPITGLINLFPSLASSSTKKSTTKDNI